MQTVECKKHKITIQLPITEDEFLSGEYHCDVESLDVHCERYPKCRFKEVQN
jgi:hypothetical protein